METKINKAGSKELKLSVSEMDGKFRIYSRKIKAETGKPYGRVFIFCAYETEAEARKAFEEA